MDITCINSLDVLSVQIRVCYLHLYLKQLLKKYAFQLWTYKQLRDHDLS